VALVISIVYLTGVRVLLYARPKKEVIMKMGDLYNMYPVTDRVLQEKGVKPSVAPELQKKRNRAPGLNNSWFEDAIEKKNKKS
jgi:hypothetical protein